MCLTCASTNVVNMCGTMLVLEQFKKCVCVADCPCVAFSFELQTVSLSPSPSQPQPEEFAEPPDIFALGFQELVGLTATNIVSARYTALLGSSE